MKPYRFIILSGIASTLLFCLLFLLQLPSLEGIEAILYDYRFVIKNQLKPVSSPQNIIIVEIDEKSLEKLGRWPWSRSLQAGLIKKILSGNPHVLAVDIVYPEPESTSADNALGMALKGSDRTVLAIGFDRIPDGDKESPEFIIENAIKKVRSASRLKYIPEVNKLKAGPEIIYKGTITGHVYSPPERDGRIRWEYLYTNYLDEFYPSLPLVVSAMYLNKRIEDIVIYGDRGIGIDETFIPTDRAGRMRINYLGKERTFHYISASRVLERDFDISLFSGKIVLLGTSAISTYDFAVSPLSARMPGVEKNATVIENIINKRFIKDVPAVLIIFLIIISGFSLSLILSRVRAKTGMLLSALFILSLLLLNLYLFINNRYMNLFYPLLDLIFISVTGFSHKYIKEEKRSRELRRIFSRYVSPKIVEQLINNPEMTKLGGQKKEITVLFADIQGFTTLSEKKEPEEVVSLLNEYFKEMTDIIFKWDGTLDKFIGDEIMAFWGAPLEQPDHAELALRCSLDMSDRLEELQKKWLSEGKPVLDCGIGINTGTVLIGNIGAEDKQMDYTAIGDHVNLGARVEKMTRECNTRILMTEFTFERIKELLRKNLIGHVEIKEVGTVHVKGRQMPVKIYSIKALPHNK